MEKRPINLTINDLIEQIYSSTGRNISIDVIKEHGKEGNLTFIVPHPDGGVFKLKSSWDASDYTNYRSDYLPISKGVFKNIISSDDLQRIVTINVPIDGEEKSLTLTPYHLCDKNDLRIQTEEALRFEKEYFSADQILTSKDLFIHPVVSELFNDVSASVDRFIDKYKRLPTGHDEVFNQIKLDYGVRSQEATLPSGNVSRDNFRRRYKYWVGRQGKNGS